MYSLIRSVYKTVKLSSAFDGYPLNDLLYLLEKNESGKSAIIMRFVKLTSSDFTTCKSAIEVCGGQVVNVNNNCGSG
jgi:hypothetical protein